MTRTVLSLMAAGALAAVPSLAIPVLQADDPVAVVDVFHRALEQGDRESALAALAEDVVIYEGGGAEMSRDEYAAGHLGGDIRFASSVERTVTDRQTGSSGDVAWVLSRSETRGTVGEREIHSLGTETMLLRRTESGWKIVHVHWSSRQARR